MAQNSFDGLPAARLDDFTSDEVAYRDGYARVMRELMWARSRGFVPTERQLVLALTQANRVYAAVRGGKFVGGRRPEWLRGRADALRTVLRDGISATDPFDD